MCMSSCVCSVTTFISFYVIIVSTSVLSCVDDRVSFTNTLLQLKMPSEEVFDLNTESTDVVTLLSFFLPATYARTYVACYSLYLAIYICTKLCGNS